MKPEVMLELLENAADQLGIKVSYEPLQTAGIQTGMRGGLCRVKGEYRVIIDKRATDEERVATLAGAVAGFDTAELELAPQVREILRIHAAAPRAARGDGSGPRRAA
jgi:hypothetical protein